MSEASVEKRFVARVRELLVSLPYDLKVLFEAMSDEDLPREARELAVGAVVYCLSPSDPIPDTMGLVGFVDDVVVSRIALTKMLEVGGEAIAEYPARFGDQFAPLEADVELFRAFFGETLKWVDWRMNKLAAVKYKGKSVADYLEDEETGQRLYEEGLEFTTEYEIDDDAAAKLVSGKPILDAFRRVFEVESARQ
ncbi:MAG: hypothetical protein CSA65_08720 [Proteobacteria bacterium]|nr:MAG: hypothetical protein CSB49_07110 [Pseudomonadota bacterium]PIE17496.1 MAG: hypothetical protein CSA65_08720 [Pseudomonadota bacterium]